MKAPFAIWIEEAELRKVAESVRVLYSGWTLPVIVQVKGGRMSFLAGEASFTLPLRVRP